MLHTSMAVCGSLWMPQPSLCLLSVDVETPREHAGACGRFDGAAPKRHGSTLARAGGSTRLRERNVAVKRRARAGDVRASNAPAPPARITRAYARAFSPPRKFLPEATM